jgi:hypothetical protein
VQARRLLRNVGGSVAHVHLAPGGRVSYQPYRWAAACRGACPCLYGETQLLHLEARGRTNPPETLSIIFML